MDLWAEDSDTEIRHFIGKDIVYFHALFWPTVLKVARFKRPAKLHVHGLGPRTSTCRCPSSAPG